jgi:hypothetical protein
MSKWGNDVLSIAQSNPDIGIIDEPAPKRTRTRDHQKLDSEHDEQVALFAWADANRDRLPQLTTLFAIPNGGYRHPSVAAKLKMEGVRAGVPDLFLAYPSGAEHGLFIEMKAGRNRTSNSQQLWLQWLTDAGYHTAVCYGAQEAIDVIEAYLVGEDSCQAIR